MQTFRSVNLRQGAKTRSSQAQVQQSSPPSLSFLTTSCCMSCENMLRIGTNRGVISSHLVGTDQDPAPRHTQAPSGEELHTVKESSHSVDPPTKSTCCRLFEGVGTTRYKAMQSSPHHTHLLGFLATLYIGDVQRAWTNRSQP